MATLKSLIAAHPEWADLPIVIYRRDGNIDYAGDESGGGAGSVYEGEGDEDEKVLVFAPN